VKYFYQKYQDLGELSGIGEFKKGGVKEMLLKSIIFDG